MHKDAPWQPQHAALLRHIMAGTGCCHAPTGHYCPTGTELRRAYDQAVERAIRESNGGNHG